MSRLNSTHAANDTFERNLCDDHIWHFVYIQMHIIPRGRCEYMLALAYTIDLYSDLVMNRLHSYSVWFL